MATLQYNGRGVSGGTTSGSLSGVPDGLSPQGQVDHVVRESMSSPNPLSRVTAIGEGSGLSTGPMRDVSAASSNRAVRAAVADTRFPLATRAYAAAAAGLGKPSGVNDAQWAAAREGTRAMAGGSAGAARTAGAAGAAGTGNS